MKAVTLRHPWPYAFSNLGKNIENRTWRPHGLGIGERYAIHAGKAPRVTDHEYWDDIRDAFTWIQQQGVDMPDRVTPRIICDNSSAVVAVTTYRGWVTESKSLWFAGPIGWKSEDTIALPTPVPCRGAQGLWVLPEDVEHRVLAQTQP